MLLWCVAIVTVVEITSEGDWLVCSKLTTLVCSKLTQHADWLAQLLVWLVIDWASSVIDTGALGPGQD